MNFVIKVVKNGISGCGVYDTASEVIEKFKFESIKEARRKIRKMIKNEGYKKHFNYIYNNDLGTELETNF